MQVQVGVLLELIFKQAVMQVLFCLFQDFGVLFRSEKNSLNIKFLGGIFLGHPGPRRRDIPDKNFMQVAVFCWFKQGVAGMSRDLGRDVPDLEKLYVRQCQTPP